MSRIVRMMYARRVCATGASSSASVVGTVNNLRNEEKDSSELQQLLAKLRETSARKKYASNRLSVDNSADFFPKPQNPLQLY
eukprot:scaffold13670_cov55-Cyclotella_meneghiniana.AAC.4